MNKKIREAFDSWDLKSLFLTILFLSVGVVIYYYFSDIRDRFRTNEAEAFKGQTIGQIIEVQKADRITQSKWNGTKIFVDSYTVFYHYDVNGQRFESRDIIPNTTKNQKLLKVILERGANNSCFIKFDLEDPKKSLLVQSE